MTDGRMVISGIGVVAPTGIGAAQHWKATQAGISGVRRITNFDASPYATRVAGEVDGFDTAQYVDRRLAVATDRWTHMALAATEMALADAGVDPAAGDDLRSSVVTSASSGGNAHGQKEIHALWEKGPKHVTVYQSIAWFYAASTGQISIKHGMRGACGVVVSEGAGGLDALAVGRRMIRRGSELVIVGGTEAPIAPYALVCQMPTGLLAGGEDPTAYRPFGADASGFIPGEGGAILVAEDLERARDRGAATIYAEVAGHGATNDAHHHSRPAPDGQQYARAMGLALADAGASAADVDAVFVDAMGVPEWDAIEASALSEVFGERLGALPVTAPKTMVGRLYSGGAALDVATAALALRDGVIPPTINVGTRAAACADLDLVTESRAVALDTVMITARGFGGFNSATVLRRFQG